MTPIEILGAALIVMVLGSTVATTNSDEDSETDIWYCFVCAGTSSEKHVEHVGDVEGPDGSTNGIVEATINKEKKQEAE